MRPVIPQPFKRELATKPTDLQGAILGQSISWGKIPGIPDCALIVCEARPELGSQS
jgi:hypothetical protein